LPRTANRRRSGQWHGKHVFRHIAANYPHLRQIGVKLPGFRGYVRRLPTSQKTGESPKTANFQR
jgi:hypothetical protein